jgi:hypothetical protein
VVSGGSGVLKYTSPGGSATTFEANPVNGIAVEPGTDNVFVTESSQITEFDPSGTQIGQSFGSGHFAEGYGVGVNASAQTVFAADNPNDDALAFTVTAVEAETGAATSIQAHSATLSGIVKVPGGGEPSYFFRYGESEGYGSASPAEPGATLNVPAVPGEAPVSTELTGLLPNTTYHYKLFANLGGGGSNGLDETFTTLLPQPVVVSETASGVARHSAVLGGKVEPENGSVTYWFEYGPTAEYGKKTNPAEIPGSLGEVELTPEVLGELEPGTEYHYRLVASNTTGTVEGPDQTFKTEAPLPPKVETESSSGVTQTGATLEAAIDPQGLSTIYVLEIGSEVKEGNPVYSTQMFGEVRLGEPIVLTLSSLAPATTYHYRFVGLNEDGAALGADLTFTTGSYPNPIPPVATVPQVPFTPLACKPGEVDNGFGQCGPPPLTCPKGKVASGRRCVPPRCPKGKVRKNGKCVKKHVARGKRKRKH